MGRSLPPREPLDRARQPSPRPTSRSGRIEMATSCQRCVLASPALSVALGTPASNPDWPPGLLSPTAAWGGGGVLFVALKWACMCLDSTYLGGLFSSIRAPRVQPTILRTHTCPARPPARPPARMRGRALLAYARVCLPPHHPPLNTSVSASRQCAISRLCGHWMRCAPAQGPAPGLAATAPSFFRDPRGSTQPPRYSRAIALLHGSGRP